MHRIYIEVSTVDTWYAIMQEARTWFGKEWSTQPRVKRKLLGFDTTIPITVWFEVPDPRFGTWIAVKLAVTQVDGPNK